MRWCLATIRFQWNSVAGEVIICKLNSFSHPRFYLRSAPLSRLSLSLSSLLLSSSVFHSLADTVLFVNVVLARITG